MNDRWTGNESRALTGPLNADQDWSELVNTVGPSFKSNNPVQLSSEKCNAVCGNRMIPTTIIRQLIAKYHRHQLHEPGQKSSQTYQS